MKLNKKLFAGVMTSVLALSGMGGLAKADAADVELTINYYHGAISDAAIEAAKKEFPDWKLNFTMQPASDDFDTKLRASLNSKSAADITAINSNIQDFKPYYEKFVNLAEYGSMDHKDDFVAWKWDSTLAEDGKYQMAFPLDIGPTALQYNKAAFEKAGLPTDPEEVSEKIKTFDDLMAAAKDLKEKAEIPMFRGIHDVFVPYCQGMTERVFNEKGELTFANGQLKEAWDYAIEAHKNGYILNVRGNTGESVNATGEGLYGASIMASWGIADLRDAGVKKEQWLVAKAPGNPSNNGGSYLAAIGTTEHPKEAAELIMFLTSEDSQKLNYEGNALFPTRNSLFNDEFLAIKDEALFGDYEFNKYFVESAKELKYLPLDVRESAALKCFEDQLQLVVDQDKDPDKAWEEAVKNAEQVAKQ